MNNYNPMLLHAAVEAMGVLDAILSSPNSHNFSEDQVAAIQGAFAALSCAKNVAPSLSAWPWLLMNHPAIEEVKKTGEQILVFMPRKHIPIPNKVDNFKFKEARYAIAYWLPNPKPTPARTLSNYAQSLVDKHGGYWASGKSAIRPLSGTPALWARLPAIQGLTHGG